MAKITPKGEKVTGTKKKDIIISTGKGVWKKALAVNAGKGNDLIDFRKSKAKNILNGEAGNDTIYGGKKNDKITGGKGNDIIYSGNGTNTVYLNKGDGKDTLYHEGKKTTIAINKSNKADTVSFSKQGNDLIMTYKRKGVKASKSETVTIKDYFNADGSVNTKISNAVLLNSKKYKNKKLQRIVKSFNIIPDGNRLIGSAAGDKLTATGASQYVDGGIGNDTITGLSGNNTLLGGTGDDNITGGSGNDLIDGSAGNDVLSGGAGNDTIYGGTGNDIINGGSGKNIIYLKKNEGTDTIKNGDGSDTLVFSDETAFENLSFNYNGNDLNIVSKGTTTVLENYKNDGHSAKTIKIGNNTYDISNVIIDDVQRIYGSTGNDLIIAKNPTDNQFQEIRPGSGDDTIYGSNRTNVYYFRNETGNKTVYASDCDENRPVFVYMGQGNDTIYAPENNELIIDLRHNIGNQGDNILYYNGGSIRLLCDDEENAGLTYSNFNYLRTQGTNDLIFKYGNTSITIKDYYLYNESNPNNFIMQYNIPGGGIDSSSLEYIIANSGGVKTIVDGVTGTDGDDYIIGTSNAETITPGAGNDIIVANGGDDIIEASSGNDIINLGSGNTTVKFDMSVMGEVVYHGSDETEWTNLEEICTKTIYMQDDTVLTLDFDDELFSNGHGFGLFCRNSGLDNDLYISISGTTGYCIRVKNYFDADGNPKVNSVILKSGDNTYTVPEWANGSYWGRTFDMQPFGEYNEPLCGTNMPYEEIRTAYGNHDDTVYGGSGNTEVIYPYGGHNEIHSGEGTKTISMWGAQSSNDIYLGTAETTKTILNFGGVQNNSSEVDSSGNLNVTWNIQQSDEIDESYTCTATIHDWSTRTSQATISMKGDNRNNTLTAVDGVANILNGGNQGDDTLIGGTGSDTFEFDYSNGYGIDEIRNATSADKIAFEFSGNYGTVNFNNFKYYKTDNGNGLVINTQTPGGANNYVVIKDYFSTDDKINTIVAINDPYGPTSTEEFSLSTVDLTNLGNFEIANGGSITGDDGIDVLIGNNGENTIEGGAGDDSLHSKGGTNTFVFNAEDGSDILYQEGGASILWFKDATIAELSSITGYDRDANGYYSDLLIHYDGTNTLRVKDYFTSNNVVTQIKDSTGTTYNMSDYFKKVVYYSPSIRGYDTSSDSEEIRVTTAPASGEVAGKRGSDRIYGSAGNDWLYTYTVMKSNGTIKLDTTPGTVDEIHGGAGDDVIVGQSETNYLYGDSGNDTFIVFVNGGLNTYISDSEGTADNLNIYDETYNNLHFVFNVNAAGIVDDTGLRVLNNANFDLWKIDMTDANIKGINILGQWDSIETYEEAGNGLGCSHMTVSALQNVKADIASWLSTNGYADVADVFANEKTEGDINKLIAKFDVSTQWTYEAY